MTERERLICKGANLEPITADEQAYASIGGGGGAVVVDLNVSVESGAPVFTCEKTVAEVLELMKTSMVIMRGISGGTPMSYMKTEFGSQGNIYLIQVSEMGGQTPRPAAVTKGIVATNTWESIPYDV